MSITEFGFSVDEFQNPKNYKNAEAIATLLCRLLLLEPGTIQSHPDMGVGLYSKYHYSIEGTANELRSNFQSQIEQYLPQFQSVNVTVKEKDRHFIIGAEIDNNLYAFYYDTDNSSMRVTYTPLSEIQ